VPREQEQVMGDAGEVQGGWCPNFPELPFCWQGHEAEAAADLSEPGRRSWQHRGGCLRRDLVQDTLSV